MRRWSSTFEMHTKKTIRRHNCPSYHAARGPETPAWSPAPVCVPSAFKSETGERPARWQQFALIVATPLNPTKAPVLRSELLS